MTEHELQQIQDYEDKCAEEETEGWLCHECAKKLDYQVEEREIAKRMIEKYKTEGLTQVEITYLARFNRWLEKQEAEERDQRISDYLGG